MVWLRRCVLGGITLLTMLMPNMKGTCHLQLTISTQRSCGSLLFSKSNAELPIPLFTLLVHLSDNGTILLVA
jgi:hypothetical protein